MKRFQKTLALLLALLTLLAAISIPAVAESYKVATLKTGKWYKPAEYNKNNIYKLKLSVDSILTINWKKNKEGDSQLFFYDNKKSVDNVYGTYDYCTDMNSTKGSDIAVMSKGTYYIWMYIPQEHPTTQVKITVKKTTNRSNYSRAKAYALKSGVTEKIYQSADHCYDRWYKITVPKKKTVTITTSEGDAEDIILYDTRMKSISCTKGSKKVITEDRIAKGTYFIRVFSPRYEYSDDANLVGRYITLKWN